MKIKNIRDNVYRVSFYKCGSRRTVTLDNSGARFTALDLEDVERAMILAAIQKARAKEVSVEWRASDCGFDGGAPVVGGVPRVGTFVVGEPDPSPVCLAKLGVEAPNSL